MVQFRKGHGQALTFLRAPQGKTVAPVAGFIKRLNVFLRAHRAVCGGHRLSPQDLAGEVEHRALNGHAVALGPDYLFTAV